MIFSLLKGLKGGGIEVNWVKLRQCFGVLDAGHAATSVARSKELL